MPYEQKTKSTTDSVADYIASLPSPRRQEEARELVALFERATGELAVLWGPSIIGFGQYHYTYASGHSGTAASTGFSPRKAAISLYLFMYDGAMDAYLARLGKHKAAKGCVYVNKLADIDLGVLEDMVRESMRLLEDWQQKQP